MDGALQPVVAPACRRPGRSAPVTQTFTPFHLEAAPLFSIVRPRCVSLPFDNVLFF